MRGPRWNGRRRGVAMILAMVFAMTLFALGLGLLQLTGNVARQARRVEVRAEAYHRAEGGIDLAVARIRAGKLSPGAMEEKMGGAVIRVEVAKEGENGWRLVATAPGGGEERQAVVTSFCRIPPTGPVEVVFFESR